MEDSSVKDDDNDDDDDDYTDEDFRQFGSVIDFFLSANPDELRKRLCILIQKKKIWKITIKFDKEIVYISDNESN